MKAFRLLEAEQPPVLVDMPEPKAGSGQIVIKVAASGLCHTDLGLMRRTKSQWADTPPPFTLGHEVAGWVSEVGPGVSGFRVGELVAELPLWGSDGTCPACRRGEENLCPSFGQFRGAGVGFDGGMAEYMVTEARFAVHVGDMDPVIAAPLTDAGLTTYSAIKPALPMLVPGTTAVVVGIGGLGLLAVQFLRSLCSARVIAVDSNRARLEFAKAHGADVTVLSDASAAEHIRDLTSGRGATFVLEGVGVDATLEMGIAVLARGGRLTLIGAAGGLAPFGLHELPWGAQLSTNLNGGSVNLVEVLELARLGRVKVEVDRYPLSRVAEAYADLAAGKMRGRGVCIPGT
jgi:propanol-preferring alcohol dehydrogenase